MKPPLSNFRNEEVGGYGENSVKVLKYLELLKKYNFNIQIFYYL